MSLFLCLAAATPVAAQPSTTFHPLGDLAGGATASTARDATKVGDTIYVVGGSAGNTQTLCTAPNTPAGCVTDFNPDTPVLWTVTGNAVTITALPNLVAPGTPPTNAAVAAAITRDAAYLASQSRNNAGTPNQTAAVRVMRSGLVNPNLTAAPFPVRTNPSAALAISDDGSILYGQSTSGLRVTRFNVTGSSSVLVPFLNVTDTATNIPGRGASADGTVIVGTSGVAPISNTSARAFRYVHADPVGTVSAIPLLPGGAWNRSIAVSSDGSLAVIAGDSTRLPNGEFYVYNAGTATITRLGSPNTPWSPAAQGGITADGTVVVAAMLDATTTNGRRMAFVHNAHGWFNLATILAARQVDLSDNWDSENMQVTGISPDGTLVFGQARHNGLNEAFVAEFPAGYLASFDMPAVPQTDPAIIGLWGTAQASDGVLVFLADGTYIAMSPTHGSQQAGDNTSGFERGRYFWDRANGLLNFVTLQDSDGDVGVSGFAGLLPGVPATATGNTITLFNGALELTRRTAGPSSLVGAFVQGTPGVDATYSVLIFLADGTFIAAKNFADTSPFRDGVEAGTYTIDADGRVTLTLTLDMTGSDGLGTIHTNLHVLADGNVGSSPSDPTPFVRVEPTQYFLSEGATSNFFSEDVLIANPNTVEAPISLTFLRPSGDPIVQTRTLPPQSRTTVHVNQVPELAGAEVSTVVTSTLSLPLVVERSMFWDESYYAGHTGSSIGQPSQDWVFAEGSQGFFSTFVLLANPNPTPADVTLTFLREGDVPVVQQVTVPASARLTIDCGTIAGIVNRSFGITVHGSQPIVAERAMYFGTTPTRVWSGGSESAGVTTASKTWFLAEGATGGFFDTFILLSNPQDADANVTVQFLLDTGDTVTEQKVVGAHQRLTINIEAEPDPRLQNAAVSTVVTADVPIVAERSMYWIGDLAPWAESSNSFGVIQASTHWGLAEGRVGQSHNFHTYILLANPQTTAAEVTVTFLRETGSPIVKTYTVPPTSRFNIDVNAVSTDLHDENVGADLQVTNGVPIVVERSMYFDWQGVLFKGGTNATAIALP